LLPGYLRDSDNNGAFTAGGWFRTGDLAEADAEGYVSIRGRKKDIVLRGGENISVTEVENLLFEHPAVREGRDRRDARPGDGRTGLRLRRPEPGPAPTLDELARFLRGKGWPGRSSRAAGDSPRTAEDQSGKVQKFRLREQINDKLATATAAVRGRMVANDPVRTAGGTRMGPRADAGRVQRHHPVVHQ